MDFLLFFQFVEDAALPVTPEDFDTSEDVAWRQQLEAESAERRSRSVSWAGDGVNKAIARKQLEIHRV